MAEVVLVCEAVADARVASTLANRVLETDAINWCGLEAGTGHTEWKRIKKLAVEQRVRVQGKYGGPNKHECFQARKALILTERLRRDARATVLVRDTDEQPRRADYEAARETAHLPTILGIAHPELEGWLLNGFVPANDDEHDLLKKERRRLGFDPTTRPERLRAGRVRHRNGQVIKKSAKYTWEMLTCGAADRANVCFEQVDLDVLRSRGVASGLTEYLDEVHRLLRAAVE